MSEVPLPLMQAVFAQPWDDDRRDSLSELITPWQCSALGATDYGDTEPGPLMFPGFLDTSLARFVEAYIDFVQSAFVYVWEWTGTRPSPDDERRLYTFTVTPNCLNFGTAENAKPPGDLSQEAKAACEYQAGWVWEIMIREFNERVLLGQARLEARAHSPLNEYRLIERDVWQHFTIVDWDRGVASCKESGDRLFSARATSIDIGMPALPIDTEQLKRHLHERAQECAAEGKPLTIVQAEAWGAEHGLRRANVRDVMKTVPKEWRLEPGEKISDRLTKLGPA